MACIDCKIQCVVSPSPACDPVERIWYDNGQVLPIILETSNKASHMIVTYILAILSSEVLGYRDVEVLHSPGPMDIDSVMQRLTGCPSTNIWQCNDRNVVDIPISMLSTEVWLNMITEDSADDWVDTGFVVRAGQLGPGGRFGWYEPKYLVDYFWEEYEKVGDHWRILEVPAANEVFWIDPHVLDKLTLIEGSISQRYCEDEDCIDGVYRPVNCPRDKSNCAVLLAEYPDDNKDTLIDQITSLDLNVSIAWIGPKLYNYVQDRHDNRQPVLFLNWTPNGIIATGNHSRITFPTCLGGQTGGCDFKLNILEKYAWHKVASALPHVFSVLEDIEMSQVEIDDILRYQYVNKLTEMEAACQWVKDNEDIWMDWIPGVIVNQTIYIGGMFTNTGSVWPQPGIEPAARMAISAINANPNILGIYHLELQTYDTQCDDQRALLAYLNYLTDVEKCRVGIVGPACSKEAETIAGLSKYFRTIMISYSTESPGLSDRNEYPYFYRTFPPSSEHSYCYVSLFEYFDWRRCATLTEDGADFLNVVDTMHNVFAESGVEVVSNRKFPGQRHSQDLSVYISEIKDKNAHIVIGNFYEYSARAVFCEAYHQGATSYEGYQWFVPAWYAKDWWNTDYYNSPEYSPQESVPCSTAEMAVAIQGIMAFTSTNMQDDDIEIVGGITVKEFNDKYRQIIEELDIPYSAYAPYAYDTVWVMAIALDKLLQHDVLALSTITSNETVQSYMEFIDETDLEGLTGHVFFDGPDRLANISILQFFSNFSTEIGLYIPGRKNASSLLTIYDDSILWVTGIIPNDGRSDYIECVFGESLRQLLGVECSTIIILFNVIIFSTVFLVVFISCFIFKKRYDKKVRDTNERMRELSLMQMNAGYLALDEWEIPRENIVLNRKLGEGAFGTVYGGEALIGDQWLAVAVKTLKVGSSLEDKLDFLSEAEMMKRFDHINIVQLLGVCTRGEPAYTVMEYMLHGDLKTYLLSRRHLVTQPDKKEAEVISPVQLSEMAFDVAAGLDYLSKLNYVHRDLACRNCLVHASRLVKIGDFGMTRPLYDSDYYRFERNGMLPVRWMAPESLIDGLFTCKSDIWSLGVVLYEIITFGSFPYQGLSNTQVLEAVKKHETLEPPEGCSLELKKLLKNCWSINPNERPTALNVMEILGTNSTLITPCLDSPKSCKETSMTAEEPPPLPPRPNHNRKRLLSPLSRRKIITLHRSHSTRTPQMKRKQQQENNQNDGITLHRSRTLTQKDINKMRWKVHPKQELSGCKRKISTSKNLYVSDKRHEEHCSRVEAAATNVAKSSKEFRDIPQISISAEDENTDRRLDIVVDPSDIDDGICADSVSSDDNSMLSSECDSRHQSTSSNDSLLPRHSKKKKKSEINRDATQLEDTHSNPSFSVAEIMSSIV
ncbi:uncharacterized protein LOC144437483 [Glandiceps talaboti]